MIICKNLCNLWIINPLLQKFQNWALPQHKKHGSTRNLPPEWRKMVLTRPVQNGNPENFNFIHRLHRWAQILCRNLLQKRELTSQKVLSQSFLIFPRLDKSVIQFCIYQKYFLLLSFLQIFYTCYTKKGLIPFFDWFLTI